MSSCAPIPGWAIVGESRRWWFCQSPWLFWEVLMLRQMRSCQLGGMALTLALAAVTATALARDPMTLGGKNKLVKAKVTAKADKPGVDGKQKVVVVVETDAGWYAYANPVGFEDFAVNATTIKVSAKGKIDKVQVMYPPGKEKKDDFFKATYKIYEGKVEIPVLVQRTPGDTSPLEISVRFMNVRSHKGECFRNPNRSKSHCLDRVIWLCGSRGKPQLLKCSWVPQQSVDGSNDDDRAAIRSTAPL